MRTRTKASARSRTLGLTLSSATQRLRERFNIEDEVKGVVVVAVDDDGPAAEKGIRPGDVVVAKWANRK